MTAADLMLMEFAPPRFLIEGLLTDGLTILGGKPKHGKSWLALLAGWAVAAGCDLDGRLPWQGEVLYLALEDTRQRLQERLRKLNTSLGWVVPETLDLHTSWPRADDNGLYHVAEWLDARKGAARLVIVDTLAKFRKPQKGNANSYADDYEAVGGLKELVDHYGVACLVLHHTRKLKADDPFDEISGTLGISGAADTLLVLDTQQKGADARLYGTGRDMADSTTPMSFTRDSGRWVLGPTAEGIDTDGRGDPPPDTKLEQCKVWLKTFLAAYAHPSDDVERAAAAAGFAPTTLRDAKARLGRKGTGELWNKQLDTGGPWWCGLGKPESWVRRPER